MKKKNQGGRPKLPKGTDKAAVIAFRMSKREKKSLESAARQDGMGLSEWARVTLLAAASKVTIDGVDRKTRESNPTVLDVKPF